MFDNKSQICINCLKTFDIGIEPKESDLFFCCEECQKNYYKDVIFKTAERIGIVKNKRIENRWQILDL